MDNDILRPLRPGDVVRSIQGRDRGRYLLVVGTVDARYVLVVDGEVRPVERPKRKNVRHVTASGDRLEELMPHLTGGRLQNHEVRTHLDRYAFDKVKEGEGSHGERRHH